MALPSTDTRPAPECPRYPQESANRVMSSVRPDKTTLPIDIDVTKLPKPCHEDDARAKCLAGFLIDLSEHLTAREFMLSMGRHAIGKHLGQTPEMVSRLFSRMQQDGLLKVDGRQITICDPESLYALARKQPVHG